MSVLIKGMTMPKNCCDCGFESRNYCFLMDEPVESLDRPASCPLVEVEPVKRGSKKVYYHGEATFSYSCSVCAMPIDGHDIYCRWCGAKIGADEPI